MKINMGIIKVEVNIAELTTAVEAFKTHRLRALESFTLEIKNAVSDAVNRLLHAEMALFLGAADKDGNKRNGFEEKDYTLKGVGTIRIRMPVDRKSRFESAIIPKYERMDPRLKEDMAILHLAGLSTRTMSLMSKRLLGVEVSPTTVSESLDLISDKAVQWLQRPITKSYWALYIDGTNFDIQRRGTTEKEPSLVVVGVDDDNRRSILAIEPGTKDNVAAWDACFCSLIERGLDPTKVRIGLMDGLPGLENLFRRTFVNSVTGRCWKHALGNAANKTPARLQQAFLKLAYSVMYAESENAARVAFDDLKRAMGSDAERAVGCLEKDLDSLLVHYRFDRSLWRALKTTNTVERVHKEFKRRTKVMEGLGERTLRCVVAFTALKLEMGWRKDAINASKFQNLTGVKRNEIESTVGALLH
jgi:transposase-like protein